MNLMWLKVKFKFSFFHLVIDYQEKSLKKIDQLLFEVQNRKNDNSQSYMLPVVGICSIVCIAIGFFVGNKLRWAQLIEF